jgi:hypothetical protein
MDKKILVPDDQERITMFSFLRFGRNAKPKVVIETQRQTFERLVVELNEAIAVLDEKPAVTMTPITGELSFALPDHFPDEALALPAPTPEEVVEAVEEKVEDAADVVEGVVEEAAAETKAEVTDIMASAKVVSK